MDRSSNEEAGVITSSEQVLDLLREHILSGKVAPGERLHQDKLAEMLDVSRTPLRTALTTLAQAGLVRYESNRGFRVREFSVTEMMEAFRIRAEMEALACRLAATQISEDEVERMQSLVLEGDRLIEGGALKAEALPAYRQMNVDFHTSILIAADNRWIASFVQQLHSVPLASDRIIMWDDHTIIERSHDDHHRIVDAFRQRDAQRAGGIMFEHISFAANHLLKRLRTHPEDFLRVPVIDDEEARPRKSYRKRKAT
ncbi:MAG: GntR family transcriptional regulator [Aliihoeflea sp.]|jgi:GntR family transcriptional regulator, vanillate catabolism transcriptional regulator